MHLSESKLSYERNLIRRPFFFIWPLQGPFNLLLYLPPWKVQLIKLEVLWWTLFPEKHYALHKHSNLAKTLCKNIFLFYLLCVNVFNFRWKHFVVSSKKNRLISKLVLHLKVHWLRMHVSNFLTPPCHRPGGPPSTGKIGQKFVPGEKNTLIFQPRLKTTMNCHPH